MSHAAAAAVSPLSIAVVGAGGIGSAFAYRLARAGHQLTVVARPGSKRLAQLERDQGLVTTTGERAPARVQDGLDPASPYDLVIVTTLAHQVDAVLPMIEQSRARAVQFMFNVFNPGRLRAAGGGGRTSFGLPFVMSTLDAEGRLACTVSTSRKTLHGDQRWADLFNAAGVFSRFEPDMPRWLRCHTPLCVAMESVSAFGQQRGGGASWSEAQAVALGLRAGLTTIARIDGSLYPSSKRTLWGLPRPVVAAMLWSVSRNRNFRELLATGASECRALIGELAEAAAQASLPRERDALLAMLPPP